MATELKPIRSEADYAAALKEVEWLWGTQGDTPDGDRLDVLTTLIDVDESRQNPMDPPDPVAAIRFRMEQQGLTRKDLEPMIGPRNRVADILNDQRDVSIHMIRRLHTQLGISADVLIQPRRPRKVAGST
ncbi:MAG: helix-turn-helix domain-containing protein [Rhodobacteraceae bacterium]|nr:helix-turn-helix domain-containing protein [Paracoccaceae bacterium]MCY4197121.1 helix-turn-helix domain-containing protein [Paracoccaceae bacterium]